MNDTSCCCIFTVFAGNYNIVTYCRVVKYRTGHLILKGHYETNH